jgi:hypothetical protein
VGQVLNWVTLIGFGLVAGGLVLLLFALVVALVLAPMRRRARLGLPERRPGRRHRARHERRAAPPAPAPSLWTGRPAVPVRQPAAPAIVSQPDIRRSALLADTMSLDQIPPRPQPLRARTREFPIVSQPSGREPTGREPAGGDEVG